jgi:hypothetical protein
MSNFRTNVLRATCVASTFLISSCLISARAATSEDTPIKKHLTVSTADSKAAANVKTSSTHAMPAQLPGAKQEISKLNAANARLQLESGAIKPRASANASLAVPATPYFYPADLLTSGGPTLATTTFHALYVDYTGSIASNWGNPEGFLSDLGKSGFIHLVDQYVGSTAWNRYTVGGNAAITYPLFGNVLYEHEIWAIVHSAAVHYGAGSGHLYHVFLPKGMDTCFDLTAECYSPDNSSTFFFCGYHSSVSFSDVGTVLFTVEPFQDVPGCAVATPSPNGQLADSTNSVLSHETFETITDPVPDSGWVNQSSLDLEGYEIGDECEPTGNSSGEFLDPTFKINGKKYEVQLEYSNRYHACAAQP